MNGTFNIKRFGKWFVSDLKACISNYGLSFMLISMMGLIIYAGTTITGLLINGTWAQRLVLFAASQEFDSRVDGHNAQVRRRVFARNVGLNC